MARSSGDREPVDGEIRLWPEDDWWVIEHVETGVVTQGPTREALENLDDAVGLHRGELGEPIETWEEERELLEELGIDPDEVTKAPDEFDGLPEFMQ